MNQRSATETVVVKTADGVSLEAECTTADRAVAAAVLCHPHPLYGGNMHNNVVGGLFDHMAADGVACLRFNFRGVGGSGGTHGNGSGERADVSAAVTELMTRVPAVPLVVAGYSFGADVALSVDDPGIAGWFAVAPPLRVVPVQDMSAGRDGRPKSIITGSRDDFRPPDELRELVAGWENCRVDVADGATHFFAVGMSAVTAAASAFVAQLAR